MIAHLNAETDAGSFIGATLQSDTATKTLCELFRRLQADPDTLGLELAQSRLAEGCEEILEHVWLYADS